MDSETNYDALRSTLDELAYLLIEPSRLTILKDSEVGSGGYGEVCLATLDETSKVAVKQLRIVQAKGIRVRVAMRLARELKIWAKAKHPNVLRLVGYYLSENYGCAQLVSPFMENGNILEYMKRTQASIETRLDFVRGISLGMAYLHSCNPPICHGDLKPANVLISEKPDAVLCDFGLATFVENSGDSSGLTTSRSIKGSTRYMSPELFQDEEAKHTLESDIWAWACTAFEIITDVIPYETLRSDGGIIAAVVRGASPGSTELLGGLATKVDSPSRSVLVTLQTLIPECWSIDLSKRLPSSGILKRLNSVELEIPNLLPVRLPRDENLVDDTAPEISLLSKSQLNGGAYHQVKLRSRDAHGWVLEDAPELEVVLRLHEDAFDIAISPNGKWLAANFPSERKLWSLENPSSPPLVLPGAISTSYEWSPDSRYLASFDTLALHIWSIESQSSKGRFDGRPTWSAAWFSNGEALAVDSGGSVSIMSSKSGWFQMGSDWMSVTSRANQDNSPMATIPIDRVGGRRIVVMPGCRQPTSSWFLGTVLGYNRGGPTDVREIIVYDLDAQKTLTRTSHDHLVRHVTISRNGEFVLLSHVYTFPTLWRLNIPDDGGGIWDIQITLTYSFTIPLGLSSRAFVCWASLSGDDDEWVISATKEGQIVIWDTQSSQPRQVVEGLPRVDSGKRPETMYCSAEDKNGPLILLYGHNSREVVIWKWWGKLFERV